MTETDWQGIKVVVALICMAVVIVVIVRTMKDKL